MTNDIKISREQLERWTTGRVSLSHLEEMRALLAAPVVERQEPVDAETRIVPLSLLAAACSVIDKKRESPKVLAELRRHTLGDLVKPGPVAVVLPKQLAPEHWMAHGWNACLNKVKELNQ